MRRSLRYSRSDGPDGNYGARWVRALRSISGVVLVTGAVTVATPFVAGASTHPGAAAASARPGPNHVALAKPAPTHHSLAPAPNLPAKAPMVSRSAIFRTIVVDNPGDPTTGADASPGHPVGTASLRAAVEWVNNDDVNHVDRIVIPKGMTVELANSEQLGPLDLTHSMFIDGAGATVNGEGVQVFNQYNHPSVEITGLTITGGRTSGDGGGMYVSNGAIVLSGVRFVGNVAADGGGIYTASDAQLWVDNSVFTKNIATGGLAAPVTNGEVYAHGDGGGLYTYGSAHITNTTIGGATNTAGNMAEEGAGLYNYDGNVVIANSVVSHNSSPSTFGYGVGLYNDEVMDVESTSIDHNSAPYGADGVGMDVEYVTTIKNSSFTGNVARGSNTTYGGGLYDDGDVTTLTNVNFVNNSVLPSEGESVYGGAVLSYAYNFSWFGGSIRGQQNGVDGESDYVEGGAIYLDGSHATVRDVTITGTTNRSLPSEYPEGGAIYVNEYSELTNLTIADTTNTGYDVYGGAIYNDDYATMTGITITGTSNHATDSSGGYIAGGLIYNDGENMAISGLKADLTSNIADTGLSTATDNSSEVDGGLVYNDYESTIDGFTATNTTSIAKGGAGYVYGGAFYNDESLILTNSQFLGTQVQADRYVEGGLFYNDDRLSARNFTMGNSTVKVLGGTMAGTPYADGSILYNDSQANLVNTTFADITASVPSTGEYSWGIDNSDLLQVVNSTIANDSVSGPTGKAWLVYGNGSSQMSMRNSILAGKVPAQNWSNGGGSGVILSSGYNIENGSTCHFTRTGDRQNTNPMILPLHNNGAPVLTAEPQPAVYNLKQIVHGASAAIDNGTNVGAPTTDARGVLRPQNGTVDIGAYEVTAPGYNLSTAGGQIYHYGSGHNLGSVADLLSSKRIGPLGAPIVAVASTPSGHGYYQVAANGRVFAFGDARFFGGVSVLPSTVRIAAMAVDPAAPGYWLVSSDGRVFAFGAAKYYWSSVYNTIREPVVGIAATADGLGYWLVTSHGHVYAFGSAKGLGMPAGTPHTVVSITATPDGLGYWIAGSNGSVWTYGDAHLYSALGGTRLSAPVVGLVSAPDGLGYWVVGAKGAVYNFGTAKLLGSKDGVRLPAPVSGAAAAN